MRVFREIESTFDFKNPAVTVGVFDGVHRGHQEMIAKLKETAKDKEGESVVITFDPFPVKFFQPDIQIIELTTLDEKLQLLDTFGIDNVVVIPFTKEFSEISAENYVEEFLVEKIGVHTFITGRDHVFGHNRRGDFALLEEYAKIGTFNLVGLDHLRDLDGTISSTRIRACLMLGDREKVKELLGH